MQSYTIQDIMDLHPCQPTEDDPDAGYPESKLRMLFSDRQSVTLLDICDDPRLPVEDRQWVLHRLLHDQIVHEAACRYAEHALEHERARGREPNVRSWIGIEAKRLWLRGEISDGSMSSAARVAAWAAVENASAAADAAAWAAWVDDDAAGIADAAAEAAVNAAGAAVKSKSGRTVWAAARAAERRWQLATLRAMIEEMEDRTHQRKGKQ